MGRLNGMSADMKQELGRCVRNGARLLDIEAAENPDIVPENWRDLIDRDILDLLDPERCVLGQLGARLGVAYGGMTIALDLNREQSAENGFILHEGIAPYTYAGLTLAWEQYFNECAVPEW